MHQILTINCGSSSIRFKLFDEKLKEIAKGHVDGIGLKTCKFSFNKANSDKNKEEEGVKIKDHQEAFELILEHFDKQSIGAIGHRVVHGGDKFKEPTVINRAVIKELEKISHLAPLHNPANIAGIIASTLTMPQAKQVAIFDTAFHQTMPEKAYTYAIPKVLREKEKIRRYGFHGISHEFVTNEAIKILKNKEAKIISCHLGNGQSITASVKGKSIDTTMGFTPLEGLIMGTRSGSIDPGIIFHLHQNLKMPCDKIAHILLKESGIKSLMNTSDMRDVYQASLKKDPKALMVLEILSYQIAKFCGGFAAALSSPPDAIVFTGGIGEHAFYLREKICKYLEFLGLKLDSKKNKLNAQTISTAKSKTKLLVIPTNEELLIAIKTKKALKLS